MKIVSSHLSPFDPPPSGISPADQLTPAEGQSALSRIRDATPARTLIDIFHDTVRRHPDALALDDGNGALSYTELLALVEEKGQELHEAGVQAGDNVGVRIRSGSRELYVAILAVLWVGAAYVPVDADDPDERAQVVFTQAEVAAVCNDEGVRALVHREKPYPPERRPTPADDCWVIFTSGSTGLPKGVAVTHRSGAAFVDAEAKLFVPEDPINETDRVLAGLSVAFDASCEEMWLAWRNGACLVPAPRALVRTGMDLGPWLIERGITVVSTVPTLAALWPAEALERVRLLIFGGEACPPELAERLAVPGREVWNTYGPTEATVVACAARLDGKGEILIGLPLAGWELAVVDAGGHPVAPGENGELIIGGVGLARYLDPVKDHEKYAPMPTLGWERAYRSGDIVTFEPAGLKFVGRADEQVKLGGRRIELGEVDTALQSLPGVQGAAAAVKKTPAGTDILVGYLVPSVPDLDLTQARATLSESLPAALLPVLSVVSTLPTKTSGKVDRAALPWPIPNAASESEGQTDFSEMGNWVAEQFSTVLGVPVTSADTDFFASGGGSLSAARLISALRVRFPEITVADIYSHPRFGSLLEFLGEAKSVTETAVVPDREFSDISRRSAFFRTVIGAPLFILSGMRWLTYLMIIDNVAALTGVLPTHVSPPWWITLLSWLIFVSPPGRMAISVLCARLLLRKIQPGSYPRGGREHLALWLAEQVADTTKAVSLASAPLVPFYARALGVKMGKHVDLHSVPPVTGMLSLGTGASVEPEVDLSGYWIDGDQVHVGPISIGRNARIGARSTLFPGAKVGAGSIVEPGSGVVGSLKAGCAYAGSPAIKTGSAAMTHPEVAPPTKLIWHVLYPVTSSVLALLPYASAVLAGWILLPWLAQIWTLTDTNMLRIVALLLLSSAVGALIWCVVNALLILGVIRALGVGLKAGYYPIRSLTGWRVWATERVLDLSRELLFPLYASLFTPVWLRLLGAKVGKNVEASTVLLVPKMTVIGDGAFLADDTMVASYELANGWMRIARAKVGRRAFLGNSGITGPGRSVPKNALVAVLSSAPKKAKAGSSWLGSPPVRLRRAQIEHGEERTFSPPLRLKLARSLWELCRVVPVMLTCLIAASVLVSFHLIVVLTGNGWGYLIAALLGGVVLLLAGAVAAACTSAAKWILVGRITVSEHPLWSSFIWRNEVSDTFVEAVAAPWFARAASGTPALLVWLRSLGATIGKGVWCESYWLPEADLVYLGQGATVNRGCVVQTHLFHDRVMSLDTVELADHATLGPHSVILPAAGLSQGSSVGPASLVMRGEVVPPNSYWQGNPVRPWRKVSKHLDRLTTASEGADPRKAA